MCFRQLTCFDFGQLSDRSACFLRTSAVPTLPLPGIRQTRAGPVHRSKIKLIREAADDHSERAVEVMASEISPRVLLTNEGVTFVTWAAFGEESFRSDLALR